MGWFVRGRVEGDKWWKEEIRMPVPVGRSKVPVGEKMGLGRNWEK
jgi:hypothetical protein